LGGTIQNLSAIPGDVVILAGTGSTNAIVDDTYNGGTSTYTVLDGAVERAGFGGVFIEGNYQTLSLTAGYAPENVNVIETPAGSTLNLNAGGGDDTVVIGTAGPGLEEIQGPVDVSNTPYYTQLTLNDVGDTTAHPNVIMNNGSVVGVAPAVINYTTATNDVNALTIDGNDTNNGYFIAGGSTLTPVTLNDGAGANQVDFIEPSLGGTYTINGQAGTTDVYVTDAASTPQTYTVTSAGLTASGFTLNVSSVALLTLEASSGLNNVVDIESLPCAFYSYGSAGSVNYLVSNNHIMPNLVDGMLLEGGTFGGTITYDDSQGVDANEPVIASSSITAGGGVCGYVDVSSITLDTGFDEGIPVNINSTLPGTPVTIIPGPGSTTIDANQTSPTGPVIISPGGGTTEVHVSINGGGANVIFPVTEHVDELTIGNGGIAMISGSGPVVLTASSLSLSGNGKLDITANTFKIDYQAGQDPSSTIRGYLKTAYAGGVWTGSGLTSSTIQAQVAGAISHPGSGVYAIGYLDGAVDIGQTLVTGNQLVFQPTIVGDTDFNGDTNFLDLGRVAQNLGAINSDWFHGDFNYDGTTNFLDIGLLAQNLNKTTINTPVSAKVPAAKVAAVITPKPVIATNLYVAGDNTLAGVWAASAPAPTAGVLFADGKSGNVLD
jgi:hypothetical protein